MSINFEIETIRHVRLAYIIRHVSHEVRDFVDEALINSDLSFGTNENTLASRQAIIDILESAWEGYAEDREQDEEYCEQKDALARVIAAINALPDDVLFSLGS
jgi:hypothetical protein